MRVGRLVSALVEVGADAPRKIVGVYADKLEGTDHAHAPGPDAALVAGAAFQLAETEDFLHFLCGTGHAAVAVGAAAGQHLAQGVDFKVVVILHP